MESTAGLGREAQVWVGGNLLTVCDNVSPASGRRPPGVLEGVTFGYVSDEQVDWTAAGNGNPMRRKGLDAERGWGYTGYGRVLQVMPVVIDFGLLRMECPHWSTEEKLVGRYVRVPIDRLELRAAHVPDWPREMR